MSGLKKYGILTSLLVFSSITTTHASSDVYANFPITLKVYSGDAKTSESYGGQMARHMPVSYTHLTLPTKRIV